MDLETFDPQDPTLRDPDLTREKLPAIPKFPAVDTRPPSRSILLQVPSGLKGQDVRGTPVATRVERMGWHAPCPPRRGLHEFGDLMWYKCPSLKQMI
jgi:hypothetical protein